MKEYRNPTNVYHPVAAYTRQIEVSRPERWLILSGQIGMKEDGIVPDDPVKQFDVALENLCCNLKTANMDVRDFLKFTLYLVGDERGEGREVIPSRLQGHSPCMTLLFVAFLPVPSTKSRLMLGLIAQTRLEVGNGWYRHTPRQIPQT